jgi:hypothetical protein
MFTDEPLFSTTTGDTLDLWYILHVYDDAGNSSPSDSIRARLIDAFPPQVSGTVASSDSSLIITWTQPDIPDFGSYRLLRDTDSNPSGALAVYVSSSIASLSFDDGSTLEGQTYYYWLDIFDLRGNKTQSTLGTGTW